MKTLHVVVFTIVFSIAVLGVSQQGPERGPRGGPVLPAIPPESQPQPNPNQPPVPIPNFPSVRERQVDFRADKNTIVGDIVQYRGHVEMTTESVIVTADEVDYRPSTKLADARGNVKVQVRPAGPIVVPLGR